MMWTLRMSCPRPKSATRLTPPRAQSSLVGLNRRYDPGMSEHSAPSRGFIVSVLALVVALIAAGLALWALLKAPDSQSASTFTGTTTDDPKGSICEDFNVIR